MNLMYRPATQGRIIINNASRGNKNILFRSPYKTHPIHLSHTQ